VKYLCEEQNKTGEQNRHKHISYILRSLQT